MVLAGLRVSLALADIMGITKYARTCALLTVTKLRKCFGAMIPETSGRPDARPHMVRWFVGD
jgi:hypothetical protein